FSNAKALDNIGIEVTGKLLHIKLPTHGRFEYLRILQPPKGCRATVVCPNRGEGVTLMIYGPTFLAIPGLKQIRRLQLFDCRDVDLSNIAKAYPHLASLDISGKAVTLRHEESLTKLKSLEELCIQNCYTMDVTAFPDPTHLPALESLDIDGLRVDDADALKAKYQSLEELGLRGKRTAEWIANNLDNPFRDWSDYFGAAAGKKAMSAWNTANNDLTKLGKKVNAKKSATILKAFVEVFNQLEAKSGLETDQRETIYDAFMALTKKLPSGMVSETHYYDWAAFA
ncbi:MAG: leucine-rich repeat domain-containing protein, partial [Planctomycetaceae bacterium]|nr:leucine-rich repeat domain-containing protein [Planctomycetaceae bacterium]